MTEAEVEVWNRPARVEKELESTMVVRFIDNGLQDFVPKSAAEEVA